MTKTPKAQLDREIKAALAGRGTPAQARDRANALVTNYKPWTSSYSYEVEDRASSLANQLTDIDRAEGRPAPPVGYSAKRYAQAMQVVRDTNSYGQKQQALRTAGPAHATKRGSILHTVQGNYGYGHGWEDVTAEESREEALKRLREYRENEPGVPFRRVRRATKSSHARKKKNDPREMKQRLETAGIDFARDFHTLPSREVDLVLAAARTAGYQKRKDAPGSRARMYYQYLSRLR